MEEIMGRIDADWRTKLIENDSPHALSIIEAKYIKDCSPGDDDVSVFGWSSLSYVCIWPLFIVDVFICASVIKYFSVPMFRLMM